MWYIFLSAFVLLAIIALLLYKLYKREQGRATLVAENAHLSEALEEKREQNVQVEEELSLTRQEIQKVQIAYSELQVRARLLAEQIRVEQEKTLSLSEQMKSQFRELVSKIFD